MIRRMLRIGCGLAFLPLLAGCMADAPKLEAGVHVPGRYEQGAAKPAGLSSTNWPHQFGSRELDRLSVRALSDNFDIATATAKIAAAQAQAQVSGAALYPTLSGYGDGSRSQSPGTARSKVPPFNSSVSNSFDLGLNASYMVDFWGRYRAEANSANFSVLASEFDRDTTRLSTLVAVANAYFQLLVAQDQLKLAHDNLQLSERVLGAIKARVAVGTGTALEQLAQESLVAASRAAVPPLDISQAQAKNALAVLLGVPPESLQVRGGGLGQLREPSFKTGLPSQLLTRRPDIAAAEARLAAQQANVASARAALLPSVQLSGKLGLQSLALKNLFRPEATLASLAAGVTEPIFDGGVLKGQLAISEDTQQELLIAYRKAIISGFSDVENALTTISAQKRHETLQAEAVAAARRSYDINEKILHEGTIDVTSVLTVEKNLFDAQNALVQIRLAKFNAYVSLISALGGGWSMPDAPLAEARP